MNEKRAKALLEIGCICCRQLDRKNDAEIHHLTSGGRRLGHDYTIPLCAYHHRGVSTMSYAEEILGVSRHFHGRKPFEEQWGTEEELLEKVNGLIASLS